MFIKKEEKTNFNHEKKSHNRLKQKKYSKYVHHTIYTHLLQFQTV